jgi:hypothetical protein
LIGGGTAKARENSVNNDEIITVVVGWWTHIVFPLVFVVFVACTHKKNKEISFIREVFYPCSSSGIKN